MGHITFDDSAGTIIFVDPQRPVHSFPLGELLISYLELDFSKYEAKRLELIELLKDETLMAGLAAELMEAEKKPVSADNVRSRIASRFAYTGTVAFPPSQESYFPDHPYFARVNIDLLHDPEPVDYLMNVRANFKGQQEQIQAAASFCLDPDYSALLEGMTTDQRYFIGEANGLFQLPVDPKGLRAGFYPNKIPLKYKPLSAKRKSLNALSDKEIQGFISTYNDFNIKYGFGFQDNIPVDLAVLELRQMVQQEIKIRRCGTCGRYFIMKGKYDARYCSGRPEGSKRTCQAIGSSNAYKQKVQDSELLRAYTRAYNRVFNQKLPKDQFAQWSEKAGRVRDGLDDEIPQGEAIGWLNNQKGGKIYGIH